MNHQLISTGAGWRCLRCKAAWDQGDSEPETCAADDEYGFVTDLAGEPVVHQQFDHQQEKRKRAAAFDDQVFRGIAEQLFGVDLVPVHPFDSGAEPAYFVNPVPDPMKRQVQGTHYRDLVIQPTEFCMRNGLDFCVGSILKYVTRHRAKNGIEDLKKGRHFVEIREAFPFDIHPPRHIVITMLEYVTRNNIRPDDAEALYRLEAYYGAANAVNQRMGAQRLMQEIDRLIASTY